MNIEKRQELEQRLVRKLVRIMKTHDWTVKHVNDGEKNVNCLTEKDVMDAVFSVDESNIVFQKGKVQHGVFIVLGNDGYDAICDYSYSSDGSDDFLAIMEGEIQRYQDKLEEEAS